MLAKLPFYAIYAMNLGHQIIFLTRLRDTTSFILVFEEKPNNRRPVNKGEGSALCSRISSGRTCLKWACDT